MRIVYATSSMLDEDGSLDRALRFAAAPHLLERAEQPKRGFGVTWWEVVRVWLLEPGSEAIVTSLVGAAATWARSRYKKRKEDTRPKAIIIYGPDGAPLKRVQVERGKRTRIDDGDDEPPQVPPEV